MSLDKISIRIYSKNPKNPNIRKYRLFVKSIKRFSFELYSSRTHKLKNIFYVSLRLEQLHLESSHWDPICKKVVLRCGFAQIFEGFSKIQLLLRFWTSIKTTKSGQPCKTRYSDKNFFLSLTNWLVAFYFGVLYRTNWIS